MSGTETVADAQEPEDLSIRELLERNFDAPSETSDEPSRSDRARAPDGKFIKTEASETDAPEATESDPSQTRAPIKSETEKPDAEVIQKVEGKEPPANWSAAHKETFKKIPPEAQEFVLQRHRDMEADYTRKTQEAAAFRRDYEPIQQMVQPFEQQMRAAGFTPATLFQAWMNVERALTTGNGLAVVKDMVSKYNIDTRQLARELGLSAPGAGTTIPPDPAISNGADPIQLPPEFIKVLQTLDQRQAQIEQNFTAQQQAAYREQERRVMNTIDAFRDAKDPSGNPLHPHYDELENDMLAILEGRRKMGQEPSLEELYDQAVWANTSTRAKLQESQQAAEQAQRAATEKKARDEARAKAERARKAGSSVTGTPGSGQAALNGAQTPNSVRDAIVAAMEEHADA